LSQRLFFVVIIVVVVAGVASGVGGCVWKKAGQIMA